MKIPSDYRILSTIHKQYYNDFKEYKNGSRSSKIYVPINVDLIGNKCKVDGDIIFGRLYYHLNKKFGYTKDDKAKVYFFAIKVGTDVHCINFPLMSAVLADLKVEKKKFEIATWVAILSMIISIISICIQVLSD